MTTSGTNTFNPTSGQLIPYCYGLCGIRRTAILQEHMTDARMALNLLLSTWGNDTPNLWTIDLVETALVQGQATYDVDTDTIMILDAYIRTGVDDSQVDRIIWPISRTEYASQPNKDFQAPPTTFWFDRTLSPTITLWQVPDADDSTDAPNLLRYYRCTTIQDANPASGETLDIPPLWMDALTWGLAARLATMYAPDKAVALDAKAEAAHKAAMRQNVENVNLYIAPMISGYYRR